MFFVSNGKIYSATFDEERKIYQELALYKDATGCYVLVPKGVGLAKKPKDRQICNMVEVVAQYGATAPEYVEEYKAAPEAKPVASNSSKHHAVN